MRTYHYLGLALLLLMAGACEEKPITVDCEIEILAGTRFFEFAHRGTDYTFYAWTNKTTVIQNVAAQLALPEAQRGQHINGEIAALPEGCSLNQDWSWYFPQNDWDMTDISIELCDGNPQYVEDHLEDYLNIDRYCPWGAYVLQEVAKPF